MIGLQPAPGPRVRDKFVPLPVEVDEKVVADLQQASATPEHQAQVITAAWHYVYCHNNARHLDVLS